MLASSWLAGGGTKPGTTTILISVDWLCPTPIGAIDMLVFSGFMPNAFLLNWIWHCDIGTS
jgi:hypothetical protein